jgi:hypothetical protein
MSPDCIEFGRDRVTTGKAEPCGRTCQAAGLPLRRALFELGQARVRRGQFLFRDLKLRPRIMKSGLSLPQLRRGLFGDRIVYGHGFCRVLELANRLPQLPLMKGEGRENDQRQCRRQNPFCAHTNQLDGTGFTFLARICD